MKMNISENILRIKELMGLINEQTTQKSSKQPGPRLTCTDSFCEGTYNGDEWGPNGEDIAHQYSNTAAEDVGQHLKVLYNRGNFSKVDFDGIKMEIKGFGSGNEFLKEFRNSGKSNKPRGNVRFYIKIPFKKVNDSCEARTSFDHSGSWGGTPELSKRMSSLSKLLIPSDKLEVSNPITSEGLTEYWIQWRNNLIQKDCLNNTVQQNSDNSEDLLVEGDDMLNLRNNLTGMTQNMSTDLTYKTDVVSDIIRNKKNKLEIRIKKGKDRVQKFTLIYDPDKDNLFKRLKNIGLQNKTLIILKTKNIDNLWYSICVIK